MAILAVSAVLIIAPAAIAQSSIAQASKEGSPATAGGAGVVTVSVAAGRMSLTAREVPLRNVLDAVAKKAGFALDVRGDLTEKVSHEFTDLPLDVALRRVLGKHSYVIEYAPAATASPPTARALHRLSVVERSPTGGAKSPGRGARAPQSATDRKAEQEKIRNMRRLRRNPTPEALRELSALLSNDDRRQVRATAASVLGSFKGQAVADVLIAALADREVTVRRRAIVSLGKVGGRGAADALAGVLGRNKDMQSRILAARALAGFPEARSALEEASRDPDSRLSRIAQSSLKRLNKDR
jgi:hypothetical protein